MKKMMSKHKMLACLVAAGLAVNLAGGSPVEAKKSDDASAATLEQQMTELQARMAELEEQLKAVKASEKATKEQLKKSSKGKNGKVVWSGSTKSGLEVETNKNNKLKSEFRLYGDADMGDGWATNFGIKIKSTTEDAHDNKYGYGYEKNKILLNAANVSKQFGKFGDANTGKITIGTMKAKVGEGLWISKGGTNQFLGEYNITKNDIFRASYGYDAHDYLGNEYDFEYELDKDGNLVRYEGPVQTRLLQFYEYRHTFANKGKNRLVDQYAGLYWGKQQPETYLGIYGRTPIVGKLWATGEWARNSNTDKPAKNHHGYGYSYIGANKATTGYAFELHYGNAKKAGDWEVVLSWLKADQNMFMNDKYTSYDDYLSADGYKGFGAELSYQLSKAAKLSLIRFWGHTVSDPDNLKKGKAIGEETKNQVYLKLTTKF
ncbi:hypothetical protein [uncultured Anaerovibrio sp.]|uniref:hypothetical protein n=1 Tax=uncultured Anaerovibrio sp. TaxID=361586 RepID=UPI0025D0CD2A|nr:hypothetical protein [uncultured Anaerovibrio sp.]